MTRATISSSNTPIAPEHPQQHISSSPSARTYIPTHNPAIVQPHTLSEFREAEGKENRRRRLHDLWLRLQTEYTSNDSTGPAHPPTVNSSSKDELTPENAKSLNAMYDDELLGRCNSHTSRSHTRIGWQEFKEYAKAKEAELWHIFHDELDLDGDGNLDTEELRSALSRSGINLSQDTLSEFMKFLTASRDSQHATFYDFRDFLLLLPRKASPEEIYRYYKVKQFLGDDGRGVARLNMEGDVNLSAEDKPPNLMPGHHYVAGNTNYAEDDEQRDEEHHGWLEGHPSLRFLLAGGAAGAVSRTCTAPLDRLKVFLITRPPDLGGAQIPARPSVVGVKVIGGAVARIYAEGGVLAFWTGNGLSVAKIFPESAIRFYVYETCKQSFATYWDNVEDPSDISTVSRFLSGGIGGITSQLSIYPIETLKTQMMSNTGQLKRTWVDAARHLWSLGGVRAYYRGLAIGLVGVFPYSAIDMSTFEGLKDAYLRSTGKDDPGVLAPLGFGSVSGTVGATSVYPLNLVRTRLQASGSSGHPERYTGVWDVVRKTWRRDGWRGFYRGLLPTLAKVVPSVSISYVVYEHSKRKLGV